MSTSSATVEAGRSQPGGRDGSPIRIVPSHKRVRTMFHGRTLADSLSPLLVLEQDHMPVYYFPRADVRMDLLTRTDHRTHCPLKGDASYWSIHAGARTAGNAVWSYEAPFAEVSQLAGAIAFYWDKVDHWFEEDEEIFGHPRDPYHRIDVRASSREVRVELAGEASHSRGARCSCSKPVWPRGTTFPARMCRRNGSSPRARAPRVRTRVMRRIGLCR